MYKVLCWWKNHWVAIVSIFPCIIVEMGRDPKAIKEKINSVEMINIVKILW